MDKFTETFNYIALAFKALFSDFNIKFISGIIYLMYSFAFDVNHQKAIVAILFLVLFDFITGIWAAKVSGTEIKSSKVLRSAIKTFIYLLLISGAHLFEVATPYVLFADDMVLAFLAVTELISLIENAGKMGFAVPKKLLNKLKEYRDSK